MAPRLRHGALNVTAEAQREKFIRQEKKVWKDRWANQKTGKIVAIPFQDSLLIVHPRSQTDTKSILGSCLEQLRRCEKGCLRPRHLEPGPGLD